MAAFGREAQGKAGNGGGWRRQIILPPPALVLAKKKGRPSNGLPF
jgi:hypothetical protein